MAHPHFGGTQMLGRAKKGSRAGPLGHGLVTDRRDDSSTSGAPQ